MLIGKKEVTPEQRERALRLVAERKATVPERFASQSFVDRMTSGSADPDAADREAAEKGSAAEPSEPDTVIKI